MIKCDGSPARLAYLCDDNNGNGIPDCDERDMGQGTIVPDPSDIDRDGDGVPNSRDLCPDEYHLTATGCSVIKTDDGDFLDGGAPTIPHLRPSASSDFETIDIVSSVHAAVSSGTCSAVAWQEGTRIFVAMVNPQDGKVAAPVLAATGLTDTNLSLANMNKALALTGDCKTAGLLWPELVGGNTVNLKFRTVDTATGAMSSPVPIDTFPLPSLGQGRLNYIGALGTLGNEFVAVWTDRDNVEGNFLTTQGGQDGSRFIINDKLDVIDPNSLKVINPDLSTTGPSTFSVGWQEGQGQSGKIMRADVTRINGNKISSAQAPDANRIGKWPGIASTDTITAQSYIGQDTGHLVVSTNNNQDTFSTFGPPVLMRNYSLFPPKLAISNSTRLALAWTLKVPSGPVSVNLANIGDINLAGGKHFAGTEIGVTAEGRNIGFAANDDLVIAAFSIYDPRNIAKRAVAIRIFRLAP